VAETEQRKLAAIMFTDMVGYSALAQRDDKLALDLLEEHRRLLREIFPRFKGVEIKTIGDAFLVEFGSALEAAQCGIEIQRALAKRNADASVDRRIELKIGIHIGDVVHRDGDVYGDGVNIASRIEPLAGAGGICISMDVERQIRNALEARFEKLGAAELKNIKLPMELFRIVLPWERSAGRVSTTTGPRKKPPVLAVAIAALVVLGVLAWLLIPRESKAPASPPGTPPKPAMATTAGLPNTPPDSKSIAVLPFANMSEDTNNAFFADGIHEDVLTTLALVRDLKVVSRTSVAQYRATTKSMRQIAQELGVAYVLEGSVRRAGNRVRVTSQLIRAGTDEHVWAKSYDRDLTDIFAIQSALATEIAGALQAALSPQEKSLIERRPTENLAAYDLFLKGRGGLKDTIPLTRAQAEQALAEAVKLDPNFAVAWGYLAYAHAQAVFSEEDHSPERLAKAKAAIETAVHLDPNDPDVIEMQGNYFYYGYRDYARAVEHYQRLLLVRPNSSSAYTQTGYVLRRQARWADSLANFRRARQLDPLNPNTLMGLGETLLLLRNYEESMPILRRATELTRSDFMLNSFVLNAALVPFLARGSTSEADAWLAGLKPSPENQTQMLFARRYWARTHGDWALVVQIDRQHAYLEPYDDPHWLQDVAVVWDLVGNNEQAVARARAGKLAPELGTLLERQPANTILLGGLATLHALLGEKEQALRFGRRAVELLPESTDAVSGPLASDLLAKALAWTGDKDAALAELARLLRTPFGENVFLARVDPGWLPLHGEPRFEALLNDPKNNAPLP
jgi:TolB-like protein/class 3 adenylate cyclase/Flp pilus assembly protein TadD